MADPARTRRFLNAMTRGHLLLDAAMGTRLIALGLDPADDDPALWNLARPEAVAEAHRADVSAGADAVVTNTFGANRAWLSRFGRAGEAGAINRLAVALAREAAGPGRFVLGSIGPVAAEDVMTLREQAEALGDAGADALLLETFRADQAEAALEGLRGIVAIPLLVSLFAWPDPPGEAARRLADRGASALGVNCRPGMASALRLALALRGATGLPPIARPSAGLPGAPSEGPDDFARAVAEVEFALGGPLLVGGCCGTTEAHIAALRSSLCGRISP